MHTWLRICDATNSNSSREVLAQVVQLRWLATERRLQCCVFKNPEPPPPPSLQLEALNTCCVCVHAQLTELKALLGCVGQVRFVMGCISQLQDGRYFLEDMSDSLPIDLSDAQTTSGFFTGDLVHTVGSTEYAPQKP